MTGQGSSHFEAIQRSKSNMVPINIGKVQKTISGDRVRGLRDCLDFINPTDTTRTHIIKGEVLLAMDTGLEWRKEIWLRDGTHATEPRWQLVERKNVTPPLPKLFQGL